METIGKITNVVADRKFFFIDNNYFCHFDKIDFEPNVEDTVTYTKSKNKDGKPEAVNVRRYAGFIDQYWAELANGYFIKDEYIRKEFILTYAKELADLFFKSENINKPTQVRKYFDYCDRIYGLYKLKRDFLLVQAELPKVIPHLNNALKKGLISNDFFNFMEKNIELALIEEKNFSKGFIPHFEALIGYSQK